MKQEENNQQPQQGGFVVHVYSPGNQIIQTQNNNYYAPVYYNKGDVSQNGFSNEQIAKALVACVGKGKVIDNKWKWAGAYWFLRWNCNYPVDAQKFCDKINSLALDIPSGCDCSYESIRKICTLSFMDYDVRNMESVKVSRNDQEVFSQCREIALKLGEELGKTYLPQP